MENTLTHIGCNSLSDHPPLNENELGFAIVANSQLQLICNAGSVDEALSVLSKVVGQDLQKYGFSFYEIPADEMSKWANPELDADSDWHSLAVSGSGNFRCYEEIGYTDL